jgi:uncharacterized protein YqfB (UPF0267 family)
MLGKIKKSMAGAKEKIKAAGSDLLDSTSMKLTARVFRVNGKKYKARKLIAEGPFEAHKQLCKVSIFSLSRKFVFFSLTKTSAHSQAITLHRKYHILTNCYSHRWIWLRLLGRR